MVLPTSFSLYKKYFPIHFFNRLAQGSLVLHTPNYNSLFIWNKAIFAGETTASLFALGEHIIFANKTTLKKQNYIRRFIDRKDFLFI